MWPAVLYKFTHGVAQLARRNVSRRFSTVNALSGNNVRPLAGLFEHTDTRQHGNDPLRAICSYNPGHLNPRAVERSTGHDIALTNRTDARTIRG